MKPYDAAEQAMAERMGAAFTSCASGRPLPMESRLRVARMLLEDGVRYSPPAVTETTRLRVWSFR